MSNAPYCEAILFCHKLQPRHGGVLFDLTGVVCGPMKIPALNRPLGVMLVYLALNDVEIDGNVTIVGELVNMEMEALGEEGASACQVELQVATEKLKVPPGFRSSLVLPIKPTFAKPGVHELRVWWGSTVIGRMSITVVL